MQMGWSRAYSFNQGDLAVCANVLGDYLNRAAASGAPVPWDDLRYIFGEIMYVRVYTCTHVSLCTTRVIAVLYTVFIYIYVYIYY